MPSGTLPTARRRGLDAVLSGELGVEPVREVAVRPWRHGVHEPGLDPRQDPGVRLTLLRTKFKPGRKLSAYYQRETDGEPGQQVAVSWRVAPETAAVDRVAVMRFPADPAMPQLSRLADPRYLTRLLEELPAGGGGSDMPGRTEVLPLPHPIRYRPGQRHVLRWAGVAHEGGVIVKTDTHGLGLRAVSVAKALSSLLAEHCPGVDVCEPLGFSHRDTAALWRLAPGTPLSREVAGLGHGGLDAVALLGRAIQVIHDQAGTFLSPGLRGRLSHHDLSAEALSTLRAGEHIRSLLPDAGRQYDDVAARVARAVQPVSAAALSVLHGDLKCDNILVDREGPGAPLRILDLDRVSLGDPALDLGKFLADLRWWCASDSLAARAEAALRAGYGQGFDAIWVRAGLLSALFDLKFAARRCVIHDRDWAAGVHRQIEVAATTLARAERLR